MACRRGSLSVGEEFDNHILHSKYMTADLLRPLCEGLDMWVKTHAHTHTDRHLHTHKHTHTLSLSLSLSKLGNLDGVLIKERDVEGSNLTGLNFFLKIMFSVYFKEISSNIFVWFHAGPGWLKARSFEQKTDLLMTPEVTSGTSRKPSHPNRKKVIASFSSHLQTIRFICVIITGRTCCPRHISFLGRNFVILGWFFYSREFLIMFLPKNVYFWA